MVGRTRQSYYERTWRGQRREVKDDEVLSLVHGIRAQMPRLGTRKLYALLQAPFAERQLKVGRDTLFRILRQKSLLMARRRRYTKTTDSRHWMHKYPNLVKELPLERPEQLFVSDITYIATEEGHNYLSLVTDAASKRIMGYCLRRDLSPQGCLEALTMALEHRRSPEAPLIHHSDRGLQYCCKDYVKMLTEHEVRISMTENGDPYENAIAERVNGILKEEFYLSETFRSHTQAARHIAQSIDIYNTERPHLSCQMMTPERAHQCRTLSVKSWKKNIKKGSQEKSCEPSNPHLKV
jgi:putative transposase